ncbi:CTD phosphatase Fcp1 [Bonamia ostreae]|uniref:protein-serine/threonine phosphatase n=1 Tax=Bonamia ostreae TaxID=126728 RepID=A0ABV2ALM6_9EUKA
MAGLSSDPISVILKSPISVRTETSLFIKFSFLVLEDGINTVLVKRRSHDINENAVNSDKKQKPSESPKWNEFADKYQKKCNLGPKKDKKENTKKLRLRLYLDNDETLVSAKMAEIIPSDIREKNWENNVCDYKAKSSSKTAVKLYLKIRDGVLEGLKRLHKLFDIVISSTGEKRYISEVVNILDRDKSLNIEIVAGDQNSPSSNKSVHRSGKVDEKHCLVLDNLLLWDEQHILVESPKFDFWDHASLFAAKKSDNFFPVFESVAVAVYQLIDQDIVSSTEEALKAIKKSVFAGKTFRFLGVPTKKQIITIESLGGRVSESPLWKNDFNVLADKFEMKDIVMQSSDFLPNDAPCVQWNYVRTSLLQLWPAKPESFTLMSLKFFAGDEFSLFDAFPVTAEKRVLRAKNCLLKGSPEPEAAPTTKILSTPKTARNELLNWYSSKFDGNIFEIKESQLKALNKAENKKLLSLYKDNIKALTFLLKNGFDPNTITEEKVFVEKLERTSLL